MISVRHYDKHGNLAYERQFKSAEEVSRFYGNKKHPDLPEPPDDGCWNCVNYDPSLGCCTKDWNNLDPAYYNKDRDDKDPDDCCRDHETDGDAEWDEFGGEE